MSNLIITLNEEDWSVVCSCMGAYYVNCAKNDPEFKNVKRVLEDITQKILGKDKTKIMMKELEELRVKMDGVLQ